VVGVAVVRVDVLLLAVLLDVVDVDVQVLQVTGHCWRKSTGARAPVVGFAVSAVQKPHASWHCGLSL